MEIRRFVFSALIIFLVAVSSVSFALPITTERIRIWQKGDEVCLALLVPGLPNELEIDKKQTPDQNIEYAYFISFFDGESLFQCGAINVTTSGLREKTVPLTMLEQTLFMVSNDGSSATFLTHVDCHVEGEELIWTVGLPVLERNGTEVAVHFETITHIGIDIFDDYNMLTERRSYKLGEDGSVINLGAVTLVHFLYPR